MVGGDIQACLFVCNLLDSVTFLMKGVNKDDFPFFDVCEVFGYEVLTVDLRDDRVPKLNELQEV